VGGGVVSRGGMDSVVNGSMDGVSHNGGGMHGVVNWGVDGVSKDRGMDSVGKRGVDSVVDWGVDGVNSVGNNSISSVKSVGGISHDGGVGSEGLALGGGPVLSLVGLAHGLVADLAVSVSIDGLVSSIVNWGHSGGDGGVGNRGSVDSVGNHRGSVDGVSNRSSMDSVGNGSSMDSVGNRGSVDSMSNDGSSMDSVSNRGISRGGGSLVARSRSLRIDSGTLVGHISDKAIISIGGVGNLLDSAVGKSNSVRSLDIAGAI